MSREAEEFEKFIKTENLGVAEICDELRRRLDAWKGISLNIGVIGNAGVGKSTFINTARGVQPSEPGAAVSGVIQTTGQPTPYEHPECQNVKFWDLPGAGTPDFRKETYLTQIQFDQYDFFIIVCSLRFTETDLWLAREIQRADKHFYFLRTKTDIDMRNNMEDHPETHNEERLQKEIKDSCTAELVKAGFKKMPVFLVCKKPLLFDFPEFEKAVISDLPELKKEVMLFVARSQSKKIIKKKTKMLEKRSWLMAAASGACGAIPAPLVSPAMCGAIIFEELIFYKKVYGLDEKSLHQLSDLGRVPKQVISDAMKQHEWFSSVSLLKAAAFAGAAAVGAITDEVLKSIPILGHFLSAGITFAATKLFLSKSRAALEKTAVALYVKAFTAKSVSFSSV